MEGSTTESVGASTAEIPGVFGRGVVENEILGPLHPPMMETIRPAAI